MGLLSTHLIHRRRFAHLGAGLIVPDRAYTEQSLVISMARGIHRTSIKLPEGRLDHIPHLVEPRVRLVVGGICSAEQAWRTKRTWSRDQSGCKVVREVFEKDKQNAELGLRSRSRSSAAAYFRSARRNQCK
jgi:hypothetical protein